MKVGFFVPCYVDALFPQAAISSFRLLRRFPELDVHYIERGACCGLPLTDMGYRRKACAVEADLAPKLEEYDVVVMPSGICTDQINSQFDSIPQTEAVTRVRDNTYDVVEFLHDILKVRELPWHPRFPHRVAIHNGCHSLRFLHEAAPSELMIPHYDKVASLLSLVEGCETGYATRRDECCGFGGTFAIWDTGCSGQQGLDKVNDYVANGFRYVVSQDCSCMLHQQGVARKHGLDLKFLYIAEILNGDATD